MRQSSSELFDIAVEMSTERELREILRDYVRGVRGVSECDKCGYLYTNEDGCCKVRYDDLRSQDHAYLTQVTGRVR